MSREFNEESTLFSTAAGTTGYSHAKNELRPLPTPYKNTIQNVLQT